MVPFSDYSHLNNLFDLARFIASHNIPVHLICFADQNKEVKLHVQGGLGASNIRFEDLLRPSLTEKDVADCDGVPPVMMLLRKLTEPIHKICRELSTNAKKLQDVNSVIFVSFGSTTTLSQEQINELALGLEQSNHRFIWVLRKGEKAEKLKEEDVKIELPQGFEERVEGRGMVVNWAPQLEILRHSSMGGFMSHCGWNSCIESISMNELVTASTIEKAVKTLMGTTEGEEMRQRVVEMSKKIKSSISNGGPARKAMESFISNIIK
ncbi:putative zeatin O-glucosyltransferase-like [Capsicum annuum]|nr:putative zeatin O-glucosyltransferase-like [Capsicum annuum]KAF3620819.1 putative zeatin O-glucosyltransferase-like [Capsicum annuum]